VDQDDPEKRGVIRPESFIPATAVQAAHQSAEWGRRTPVSPLPMDGDL